MSGIGDTRPGRPDLIKGADGAMHSTHVDKPLSDEASEDDWDLSEIRDGWGFDEYEYNNDDDGVSE
jgi:hypothetical protein